MADIDGNAEDVYRYFSEEVWMYFGINKSKPGHEREPLLYNLIIVYV